MSGRSKAGGYAEYRYRRGLRSWRAANHKLLLLVVGPVVVAGLVVVSLDRDLLVWCAGLIVGAAVALWVVIRETPPRYVETWRLGAEGERQTEKELQSLEQQGWRVIHDVQNGHGNYDHVAVGPGGVYLLESKNLQGIVEIKRGIPQLSRRHDPDLCAALERVPRRALADAARLKNEIQERTGQSVWVQAVVVLWSEFPEAFVQTGKCVFVEGPRLLGWLEGRPRRLREVEVREIGVGVERIAEGGAAGMVLSGSAMDRKERATY